MNDLEKYPTAKSFAEHFGTSGTEARGEIIDITDLQSDYLCDGIGQLIKERDNLLSKNKRLLETLDEIFQAILRL